MNTWARYLRILACTMLSLAGAVVLLVSLVDPYGISPIGMRVDGLTAEKPARDSQMMRYYKQVDVINQTPDIVFLGSSKTNQAIDSQFATSAFGAPVYNAGLDDGRLVEYAQFLQYIIDSGTIPSRVYIEIFPRHFMNDLRVDLFKDALRNPLIPYFSRVAVAQSLDTVYRNVTSDNTATIAIGSFDENGDHVFPERQRRPDNSMNDFYTYVTGLGAHDRFSRYYDYPDDLDALLSPASEIQRLCDAHDIRCVFYAVPQHPFELLADDLLGRLDPAIELKRRLVQIGDVVDFTRWAPATWPSLCQRVSGWHNTGHFTTSIGNAMTSRLAGDPLPGYASSFGVRLTPNNIDSEIALFRSEWRRWRAQSGTALEPMFYGTAGPYPCPDPG